MYIQRIANNSGRRVESAAEWSPADLTLSFWYDPSDLSTLFQDAAMTTPVTTDGDVVGAIMDKSGNGNHLTQSTTAAKPLYRTSGGIHWIQFDGTDDWLSATAILATGGTDLSTSLCIGYDNPTGPDYFPFFAYGDESLERYLLQYNGDSGAVTGTILQGARNTLYAGPGAPRKVNAHIASYLVSGATYNQRGLVNGVQTNPGNNTRDTTLTLKSVGCLLSGGSPSLFEAISLYGMFAYSGEGSADITAYTTATLANAWMNGKSGAE